MEGCDSAGLTAELDDLKSVFPIEMNHVSTSFKKSPPNSLALRISPL